MIDIAEDKAVETDMELLGCTEIGNNGGESHNVDNDKGKSPAGESKSKDNVDDELLSNWKHIKLKILVTT